MNTKTTVGLLALALLLLGLSGCGAGYTCYTSSNAASIDCTKACANEEAQCTAAGTACSGTSCVAVCNGTTAAGNVGSKNDSTMMAVWGCWSQSTSATAYTSCYSACVK